MKKPKITEGGWENYEDSIRVFQNPESRGYIEICKIEQDWDDSRANAKAISAVPEMIDALIEAHYHLIAIGETHPDIPVKKHIEIAETALKKAGCTE